jgi:hypothetical protein
MAQRVESSEKSFSDYYRCLGDLSALRTRSDLSSAEGYFTFDGALCYGRRAGGEPSCNVTDALEDVSDGVMFDGGDPRLPFALSDVVSNLRLERYRRNGHGAFGRLASGEIAQRLYYFVRPLMGVGVRKHLQKARLTGWERIAFPRWPVDVTIETLMERTMALLLRARGLQTMPFIWFWPNGAAACAMMTHDVEGPAGIEFCEQLMDLDDESGIKSAFQLVPQRREVTWRRTAAKLRRRGFEVNLHDLNHDGYLFHNRTQFLERASLINRYARDFGCAGFRSGSMYREQSWYDAFEFSYDMSVPNAAHLEPQRGGCCTVMPYFIGNLLELPLTTTQDYSLFHILADYSTTLWEEQMDRILARHGLISVIAHPDYLVGPREQAVYKKLLGLLAGLRARRNVWVTLPGEIDTWWRSRHAMTLVRDGGSWRIDGPESHRARVAYASLHGDRVTYTLAPAAA